MRVSEEITLILPLMVYKKIDEVLRNKEYKYVKKPEKELLIYLVSELITLGSIKKKREYHNLKTEKIKSILGYKLNSYIKILQNEEIIISDNHYIKGKKSKHYKLNPAFIGSTIEYFKIDTKGKLYESITKEAYKERKNHNRLKPHLKQMKDLFYKLDYDCKEALKSSENNLKEGSLLAAKSSINNLSNSKTKYFKRNQTNKRLDTNYTNLNKSLRQFINHDNLVNLDLKNSQPLIFSLLLNVIDSNISLGTTLCYKKLEFRPFKRFKNKQLRKVLLITQNDNIYQNEEIKKLMRSCLRGAFYDDFLTDFKGLTRSEIKELMFMVLFSRNKIENSSKIPYSNEKAIFKTVYPLAYKVSCILKDDVHSDLAIALQELESFIFIDVIAKELCENGIIPLTIHDSFIIPKDKAEEAKKIACNVFKTIFGAVPSFSIETL
jgi:hypothetical protein